MCLNFVSILFQVSDNMDKSLSDVEETTAKGRDVLKVGLVTLNPKSADATCAIEAPQIEEENLVLIKKRIKFIERRLNYKNKQHTQIIKSFFKRTDTSCNPSICPDIISSSSVSSGQDKLKGGGKDDLKVKRFTSDNNRVNLALNALRSSSMLNSYGEHGKCAAKTFCHFCLLRSIVFKINMSKGRQAIQPVEVEVNNTDNMSIIEILQNIVNKAVQSEPSFSNVIKPLWTCTCCSKQSSNTEGNIVYLDNNAQNREISNLLNIKYCSLKKEHLETALTEFVCHNQNLN